MIFVLMGAPGAGKGTQADMLVEDEGYVKISTGDALRRQIQLGTDIGKKASGYMSAGELVPDEILLEILKAELLDKKDKVVLLDGYPRNVAQAQTLQEVSKTKPIKGAIHIDVETAQLVERLSGRRTCSNCGASYHVAYSPPTKDGVCDRCSGQLVQRPDDQEDKVKVRLQVYEENTKPVLDFYKNLGIYRHVDGSGAPTEVNKRVRQAVGEFLG
ncbi:MAG: adenylate kinase [Oligoflexus sp.]